MTEEKGDSDDWWDSVPKSARVLILGAILSSIGSGAVNMGKDTSDRYHGSQARQDFAARDKRIDQQEATMDAHLNHAAKYTQIIDQQQREIAEQKARIRELERALYDHRREGH